MQARSADRPRKFPPPDAPRRSKRRSACWTARYYTRDKRTQPSPASSRASHPSKIIGLRSVELCPPRPPFRIMVYPFSAEPRSMLSERSDSSDSLGVRSAAAHVRMCDISGRAAKRNEVRAIRPTDERDTGQRSRQVLIRLAEMLLAYGPGRACRSTWCAPLLARSIGTRGRVCYFVSDGGFRVAKESRRAGDAVVSAFLTLPATPSSREKSLDNRACRIPKMDADSRWARLVLFFM